MNTSNRRRARNASGVVASIAACLVSATAADATPVTATDFQTNNQNTLPHTYVPSATDLLSGVPASASTGNFKLESTGGLPVLTDGSFPTPISRAPTAGEPSAGNPFQFSAFADGGPNAGTSVTYTLPNYATVTSIVTYGGWQDGGRDQQSYSVLYSTAAAPTTFIPYATVNFNPTDPTGNPQVTRVTLTDTTGTIATNVRSIRFDFTTAVENNYTGYAELDVIGTAVPEPTSAAVLGLGALGLLARRRRTR